MPAIRRRAKRRAASDIPPLAEDVGPELAPTARPRLGGDRVSAASGEAVIAAAVKTLPNAPGVYRMIDADGDVLYVGKARSLKKRVISYTRLAGQSGRIARMIRATATMDFVRTRTETEALLLEANLIKRLRPRFNVLLPRRQVVSLHPDRRGPRGAGDHEASRRAAAEGKLFRALRLGRRGRPHRQHAAEGVSDPHLLGRRLSQAARGPACSIQIKRCSAPCTREIALDDYRRLVAEAKAFLSGSSQQVKADLARADGGGLRQRSISRRAALYRDRLAALSHIQSHQGINPQGVDEADVFAVHQDGGLTSIQVFFFRTGQNWGNRAYFPKADKSLDAPAVLEPFLAQFYDDKPVPRLILVSHRFRGARAARDRALRAGRPPVEIAVPQRGEKRELVEHALANAREALARKLADTSSQARLLCRPRRGLRTAAAAAPHRGLRQQPRHGHERRRRDDRRRAGGLFEEPLSQIQHPRRGHDARRRFRHDARGDAPPLRAGC